MISRLGQQAHSPPLGLAAGSGSHLAQIPRAALGWRTGLIPPCTAQGGSGGAAVQNLAAQKGEGTVAGAHGLVEATATWAAKAEDPWGAGAGEWAWGMARAKKLAKTHSRLQSPRAP